MFFILRTSLIVTVALFSSMAQATTPYDETTPTAKHKYKGTDARPLTAQESAKLNSCLHPVDSHGKPIYVPGYEAYISDPGDCSRLLDQRVEMMAKDANLAMDCYFTVTTSGPYIVGQNLCQVYNSYWQPKCFSADLILRSGSVNGMLAELASGYGGQCF